MMRKVFLSILVILVVLSLSVIGYFFISGRYKQSPSLSATKPPQTLAPTSGNVGDVNLGGTVKPIVSGFFGPKNNDRGDHVVTIVGQLNKAVLGPGNNFSFEMGVVNAGKSYTVSVDLGPKDFAITEYTATTTNVTNLTSPNAVKVTQQLSGILSQDLFEKYKNKIGQMVAFDIVTNMQTTTPANCDTQCTTKISLYETYSKNNKLLETPDQIDSNNIFQVGVVSQMTGGSYVL